MGCTVSAAIPVSSEVKQSKSFVGEGGGTLVVNFEPEASVQPFAEPEPSPRSTLTRPSPDPLISEPAIQVNSAPMWVEPSRVGPSGRPGTPQVRESTSVVEFVAAPRSGRNSLQPIEPRPQSAVSNVSSGSADSSGRSPRVISVSAPRTTILHEQIVNAPAHVRATYTHAARIIQRCYRRWRMRHLLNLSMLERQRQEQIRNTNLDVAHALLGSGLSIIAAQRRKSLSS